LITAIPTYHSFMKAYPPPTFAQFLTQRTSTDLVLDDKMAGTVSWNGGNTPQL